MIARAAAHWRANALGLLLVACGGNGAPDRVPADTRLPTCAPYKGMDNAWGYCIYKLAGGFPTRQDVEDLCPQSGAWEDQCRHAWVAGRMQPNSGVSTEDLLAVCAGNADCAFELIDFRPEAEVTDQIARCHEYAGRHGEDCVGHAVQRWWIQDPDADEVARIQALDLGFPRQVGFFVAASTFCAGVGSCAGFIENQRICETQLEVFRRRPETQWGRCAGAGPRHRRRRPRRNAG
jgi:hypothetical protein